MSETRGVFKTGVSAVIYTNTNRLIKGNTVRDKFLVMADSVLFIDSDKNVAGGYLGIHLTNHNVDISFIKSTSPSGLFLKDDGSWASADSLPTQSGHSGEFLITNGSSASWTTLTANTVGGTFLFTSGYGIDTRATGDSDVLNIGTTNANVINYGNSSTVHNFLGTAIYELQVNSYIQDKVITLNYGGAVSSGIGVGFEIQENSVITGYFKSNSARNGFSLKTPSVAYLVDLNTNLLTADRAFSFPNTSGTLIVGTVNDQYIAFGSSGALTGSSDFSFNVATNVLTLNGLINSSGSAGFQIGGSTKFSVSSSLLTNYLPMTFAAGSTSAAPITLVSGSLLTTPVAGSFEFLTDRLYFTKTTGSLRQTIAYLSDITTTSPAGSDTNIQFNNAGSFGASARFVISSSDYLKLDGSALFGMAVSNDPGAFVDIGAATSGRASMRIRSSGGTAPSNPNEGDIWFNGTFLFIRVGGANKKFTVTA